MTTATVTLSPEAYEDLRKQIDDENKKRLDGMAQAAIKRDHVLYLKYQTGNAELDAKLNKPSGWATAADVIWKNPTPASNPFKQPKPPYKRSKK